MNFRIHEEVDALINEMALNLVEGTIVIEGMAGWKRFWWWHGVEKFLMIGSHEPLECFRQ